MSGEISLKNLIGTAAIIDFVGKGYNATITKEELLHKGKHIQLSFRKLKTGFFRIIILIINCVTYIYDHLINHDFQFLSEIIS